MLFEKAGQNTTKPVQINYTQKTGIWESPKKQMQMIHHQGNAHVQLTQLPILCNLNLTVQNKQKENFYKTVTSQTSQNTQPVWKIWQEKVNKIFKLYM